MKKIKGVRLYVALGASKIFAVMEPALGPLDSTGRPKSSRNLSLLSATIRVLFARHDRIGTACSKQWHTGELHFMPLPLFEDDHRVDVQAGHGDLDGVGRAGQSKRLMAGLLKGGDDFGVG